MKRQVYIAPEGYVYDWAEPHYDDMGEQVHLYTKYLSISKFDTINNYVLKEEK